MPRRSSPARTDRALSLAPLRICFSPVASPSARAPRTVGSVDAGGIDGNDFASLHAFQVDEPKLVAGTNRNRDDAAAGHGVALLARRKGSRAAGPPKAAAVLDG